MRWLPLMLLGFALATPAEALAKRGDKQSRKAKKKEKKKNGADRRKEKRKKKRRKGPVEEPTPQTSYQIELEIQKREGKIKIDRKRGIDLLEEFIEKHKKSRAMPEALYRLAALYWERSQFKFLDDMESWAKTVDGCKEDPEACPQGPPAEPQLDLTDSQALYERLIGEFPGFRKLDTVRYLYAFSLRDQGRVPEAQAQFWAIIQKHPNSTFVPDSWLAVGDHRFYQPEPDFQGALDAYAHVLEYPESDSYAMALFKTAWCHWKLGDGDSAVRRFKEVLDQGADESKDEAGRKRLADLREEALEYLVQVLTEDEGNTPKDIYDFLASIDGTQYSRKVLVRLGEAYEAQTRYDKSVPTYRFLIDLDPSHKEAADFQIHVFTGVRGTGKAGPALDELETLYTQYGLKTTWAKAHPKEAQQASEKGEELLYDFARSIHENAQAVEEATKVPDKERYGLAARGYEDYVKRYPSKQKAVEISYLTADIYYFKLERKEDAGDAYLRVGESAPVGPLHRDALLAAINAFEEAMAAAPASAKTVPTKEEAKPTGEEGTNGKTEPEGVPPPEPTIKVDAPVEEEAEEEPEPEPETAYGRLERKFIRAVDLFSQLFPDDKENGAVLYKLAEYFYQRGDFDQAVQRYGKVAVDYPESENAGAAGDRILESLNKAEDYDNIELWAGRLKEAPAFKNDPGEIQRLNRIIVDSLLAQGDKLVERGYYDRAAGYYLRMANEYPKHSQAPVALSNAGASLERAKKSRDATAVYERLAREHAGTKEAATATLVVARVYENMGDYERAASRYDELTDKYKNHDKRPEALYNAGVLYEALGNAPKAVARYSDYSKRYTSREDSVDVQLRIGKVQAQAGQHGAAVKSLKRFIKKHPRSPQAVEANMLLGKSLLAQGKGKSADKALQESVKGARRVGGKSQIHGAEARYLQGEVVYKDFERAKLDQRPAKLGVSLKAKAKLLGDAKNIYLDVLSLSSAEWSTAALFRIGESYELFAKSLRQYPVPKKLSESQRDAYSEQLDTFALAFEEEAIGAYRSGYQKAMELKIYNKYTRQIRSALGRLSSQEYPPIAEVGTDVTMVEGSGGVGRPIRKLKR